MYLPVILCVLWLSKLAMVNSWAKPPLMPAMAMQVRPDLYASAITPLLNQYRDDRAAKPPLMPAMAMQVRPDLYASAITPLVSQYGTTGRRSRP